MSYLRFTPDEFRNLSTVCSQLRLHRHYPRPFKRLLVQALHSVSPLLAERITAFRWADLRLIFEHFTKVTCTPTEGISTAPLYGFDRLELLLITEECASMPLTVRFVRPFKRILVERFQEFWPILARKVAWLSGQQFERLIEQVSERGQRNR